MSFFPAQAELTTLVGSLGAGGAEGEGWGHTQKSLQYFHWRKADSKVMARLENLLREQKEAIREMLNNLQTVIKMWQVTELLHLMRWQS